MWGPCLVRRGGHMLARPAAADDCRHQAGPPAPGQVSERGPPQMFFVQRPAIRPAPCPRPGPLARRVAGDRGKARRRSEHVRRGIHTLKDFQPAGRARDPSAASRREGLSRKSPHGGPEAGPTVVHPLPGVGRGDRADAGISRQGEARSPASPRASPCMFTSTRSAALGCGRFRGLTIRQIVILPAVIRGQHGRPAPGTYPWPGALFQGGSPCIDAPKPVSSHAHGREQARGRGATSPPRVDRDQGPQYWPFKKTPIISPGTRLCSCSRWGSTPT